MVLLGVHHMKGSVTRGLLTKDVRSADGWQIGMDVFEQYVQVRLCYVIDVQHVYVSRFIHCVVMLIVFTNIVEY